jgi:hypothetical protein
VQHNISGESKETEPEKSIVRASHPIILTIFVAVESKPTPKTPSKHKNN